MRLSCSPADTPHVPTPTTKTMTKEPPTPPKATLLDPLPPKALVLIRENEGCHVAAFINGVYGERARYCFALVNPRCNPL